MTTQPRWWILVTGVMLVGALITYRHFQAIPAAKENRARAVAKSADVGADRKARSPSSPMPRRRSTTGSALPIQGALAFDDAPLVAAAASGSPGDEDPYMEAADWERMTDQELEDRGMTQAALYGAQQGMRWLLIEHSLRAAGQEELAARVNAVGRTLRGLQQARAKQLDSELAADELTLLDDLEQIIVEMAADEEASTWVQELREGYTAQSEGRGPNVRDKIAREREEALSRTNVDQETATAEEDSKHAGTHAPPAPSAADTPANEKAE